MVLNLSPVITALNLTHFAKTGPLPSNHIPANRSFYSSRLAPFGTNMQFQCAPHSIRFTSQSHADDPVFRRTLERTQCFLVRRLRTRRSASLSTTVSRPSLASPAVQRARTAYALSTLSSGRRSRQSPRRIGIGIVTEIGRCQLGPGGTQPTEHRQGLTLGSCRVDMVATGCHVVSFSPFTLLRVNMAAHHPQPT